ncbi:MAG: hypothetical protein Q4G07_04400 [Oscillospiraceae bacterium]|nr:hypothetical protein [Oscillospiraceae bacterium]
MKKHIALWLLLALCAALFGACGEPGYTAGVWEGKTYTNQTLGFQLELDDNWLVATAQEMEELNENGATAMGLSEEQKKQLREKTVYDTIFTPKNADVTVQITAENLKKSSGAADEDSYLNSAKAQLSLMQAKETYEISDIFDVTLGGRAYRAMEIVVGDGDKVQRIYVSRVGDDYMSVINIAASGDHVLQEVEELFQPLS